MGRLLDREDVCEIDVEGADNEEYEEAAHDDDEVLHVQDSRSASLGRASTFRPTPAVARTDRSMTGRQKGKFEVVGKEGRGEGGACDKKKPIEANADSGFKNINGLAVAKVALTQSQLHRK